MRKKKLFIAFFKAEIDDALEGLKQLSSLLGARLNKGEITNYVYSENEALLGQEISALKKILPLVDSINIDAFNDVNALALELGNMLQMKVEAMDDPRAVREITNRKIKKVLNYILEQPE
jgi:hypothetical protein